ncbi:SIS domain-containing protein [Herbaspirillum rhizosphaerae]|uniref:SIS domain-containing protein n=1 Tax=Herbaspirillum rhizosphaerae TaxID=346179 RepID=A0ABW8ZAB2_9BURK
MTSMTTQDKLPTAVFTAYASRLQEVLATSDWSGVAQLAQDMKDCWISGRQVFFCGNGGSAGNAIHLANDYLYGIAKRTGGGMRVSSLSANAAVITCLANDIGYDYIYSEQLAVQAQAGDLLIVLSGSGNSPNILRALEQAKTMGVKTCAILGYSGGKAKAMCDVPIHFAIDDMQIAEDMQLVVGHMIMQWLYENKPVAE